MKKYGLLIFLIFLISLALLPFLGCAKKESPSPSSESVKGETEKIEYYTCTMHPHIHADKPGNCPICGMPLVPVYSETLPKPGETQPSSLGSVHLSAEKQQLIGISTEAVERRRLIREINASGRVLFDRAL